MLSRFHLVPERNGQTDRQTDVLYQYRASVCWRVIKSFQLPQLTNVTDGQTDGHRMTAIAALMHSIARQKARTYIIRHLLSHYAVRASCLYRRLWGQISLNFALMFGTRQCLAIFDTNQCDIWTDGQTNRQNGRSMSRAWSWTHCDSWWRCNKHNCYRLFCTQRTYDFVYRIHYVSSLSTGLLQGIQVTLGKILQKMRHSFVWKHV